MLLNCTLAMRIEDILRQCECSCWAGHRVATMLSNLIYKSEAMIGFQKSRKLGQLDSASFLPCPTL